MQENAVVFERQPKGQIKFIQTDLKVKFGEDEGVLNSFIIQRNMSNQNHEIQFICAYNEDKTANKCILC